MFVTSYYDITSPLSYYYLAWDLLSLLAHFSPFSHVLPLSSSEIYFIFFVISWTFSSTALLLLLLLPITPHVTSPATVKNTLTQTPIHMLVL